MPSESKRKRRIRQRMYKRQKGLCWICGEKMAISVTSHGKGKYASFDHIIPKSEGGTNEQTNLRLAHQRCNNLRGTIPVVNVLALQVSSSD